MRATSEFFCQNPMCPRCTRSHIDKSSSSNRVWFGVKKKDKHTGIHFTDSLYLCDVCANAVKIINELAYKGGALMIADD